MAPTTHDVIPIRETQNYWGLHPHEDITIGKGGKVSFRTAIGFHDVAAVTKTEWEACDVSNPTVWVNTTGDVLVEGAGEVTKDLPYFYTFTYFAETPGTYYLLCTVDGGGHCKTGQKLVLTVTEDTSDEEVTVMGRETPFWTVGVGYSDMTINLGDSLRFVSDSEGYHDVALLNPTACGAFNNYACCTGEGGGIGPALSEILYSTSDYKAEQEYTWTPDAAGKYEVVCTVMGGLHCAFGQRFALTVNDDSSGALAVNGDSSNITLAPTLAPTLTPSGAVNLEASPFLAAALLFAMLF